MDTRTLKNIYKKINHKTKLQSHKLKLSAIDDITNAYLSIKADDENIQREINQVISKTDTILSQINEAMSKIEDSREIQESIIRSSLELGIDLPSDAKVAIDQISAHESSLGNASSQVEAAQNNLLDAQDF
jgi:hypothetical protein